MPRIAGITIPENKKIKIALTYIYGIGDSLASVILKESKIDPEKRAKELKDEELALLKKGLDKCKIEGELRRQIISDIKRLREIKCHRGIRHIKGLPVRGQKTKKNSRTVRGNVRKTVSSGRKTAPTPK